MPGFRGSSQEICQEDLGCGRCNELQQVRALQAQMGHGFIGHADSAMHLDIGAAIVESGLIGEALGRGNMKGGID